MFWINTENDSCYTTTSPLILPVKQKDVYKRQFFYFLNIPATFYFVEIYNISNIINSNDNISFFRYTCYTCLLYTSNDGLLSIIGEAPTDKNCLIFDWSTYESCCKSVKRWVKRAGIDKHISWHLARRRCFDACRSC